MSEHRPPVGFVGGFHFDLARERHDLRIAQVLFVEMFFLDRAVDEGLDLVGASPDDRAALARAAAREGVGDALAYAPHLPDVRLAALVRGARAAVLPV